MKSEGSRVASTHGRNCPLERPRGRAGRRVEQPPGREASGRPRESTRSTRDGRVLDDGRDRPQLRLPGERRRERVPIGGGERVGPHPARRREVHRVRKFHREPAQMRHTSAKFGPSCVASLKGSHAARRIL
jgi:hypothetical protein